MRPSSPLLDSVRDHFEGQDQMAKDFSKAFVFTKDGSVPTGGTGNLYDVCFLVGQGKNKTRLYGVRAILGVRSRVFQELLYGISTGFGSPQVPVAEILARAVPSLHGGAGAGGIGSGVSGSKQKSSNFLQVPEVEGPRPKSVPSTPSIPRAFSNLRQQLSSAWQTSKKSAGSGGGSGGGSKQLKGEDKKKWISTQDCCKL